MYDIETDDSEFDLEPKNSESFRSLSTENSDVKDSEKDESELEKTILILKVRTAVTLIKLCTQHIGYNSRAYIKL